MIAACMRPDLVGPVVLAGAPLSYWGGVHGKNPMRYLGGMLGGSWLDRITSDMGNGIFDAAWLVANFDDLNPANTLWIKQYNVWAKPEEAESSYLHFEKWWGDFVLLRGEELPWMVDNLSVPALDIAYRITRRGGTTVTAGLPPPGHMFVLPAVNLVAEERTVKGSYIGTCVPSRDLPRYIELYRGGTLPVDRLMSGRLSLDEINLGFDRLSEGKTVRQIVVF